MDTRLKPWRIKPWLALVLMAAVIFAVTAAVDNYRHRFVRSDGDLFRFLPQRDATLFYVNVDALRRAGVLQMLAGTKQVQETAYRDFVRQTGFDYARDLEALAGSSTGDATFSLIRGHFDWDKLRAYSGNCADRVCRMSSSKSDRWISFIQIQPDVMGLAISRDPRSARFLRTRQSQPLALPEAPVWMKLSQSMLTNPGNLPLAFRLFAISLQSANPVVLSLAPNSAGDTPIKLTLDAECQNSAAADTIRNQLELDTKMLRLGLLRQHIQPNPSDLTGLLTAGSFQVLDSRVIGVWPINKQLLHAFE